MAKITDTGRIVAMLEHKGILIIATERGLYRYVRPGPEYTDPELSPIDLTVYEGEISDE